MTGESVMATNPPETARNAELIRNATIAVAAFLSLLGAIRYGLHPETLVVIFVICVLVVISRIDLEHRIIPNRIVVPAWIAVLIAQTRDLPEPLGRVGRGQLRCRALLPRNH